MTDDDSMVVRADDGDGEHAERAAEIERTLRGADDAKRADAERDAKMEKLLSGIDAVMGLCDDMKKRLDALEAAGKPAEPKHLDEPVEPAADGKHHRRADSVDDDALGFDSLSAPDREARIADERRRGLGDGKPVEPTAVYEDFARKRYDAELKRTDPATKRNLRSAAIASAHRRADQVMTALGEGSAPFAMAGETPRDYRLRLMGMLRSYSTKYRDVDLSKLDGRLFGITEDAVYADAQAVAVRPSSLAAPGQLRIVTKRTDGGHVINEFYGDPSAWMNPMAGPLRNYIRKFHVPNARA